MPKDELPSLDDFTENPVELPSVDEFITEEKVQEELPSVDEYVVDIEEALGCIPNNVLEDLPSIEYAANVHGLPQKPIKGIFSGIAFLMFVTA